MVEYTTPEVLWAQRSSKDDAERNYIRLTIAVPDVPPQGLQLKLTPTTLTFTGTSETKKTTYHLELEFYDEIDAEKSKTHHTAKDIEMQLRKKALKQEYWPRLLKNPAKVHFLRTDFDKWVDEDEQDEKPDDDYLNSFGGMGGDDGGFGGIDFSKLSAGAGGDSAMPGMEGLGGEGQDEGEAEDAEGEDEEMPDLLDEDAEAKDTDEAAAGKGKAKAAADAPAQGKIEEVE